MAGPVAGVRAIDESLSDPNSPVIDATPITKSDNPTDYRSVAQMSNEEIASQANNAMDPVGRGVPRGAALPQAKLFAMTGVTDPIFAKKGFAIGDRVYHKERKIEGTIEDLSASGKALCRYKVRGNKTDTAWWSQQKLVKL